MTHFWTRTLHEKIGSCNTVIWHALWDAGPGTGFQTCPSCIGLVANVISMYQQQESLFIVITPEGNIYEIESRSCILLQLRLVTSHRIGEQGVCKNNHSIILENLSAPLLLHWQTASDLQHPGRMHA